MNNPLLVPELRDFLNNNMHTELSEFCESDHPAEIAELISALEPHEAWTVLSHAEPQLRVDIFIHIEEETQLEIVETMKRKDVIQLITDMPPDDRADLFKHLPEEKRETILPGLAQAEREDIRRLMSYREGTAGSVMTSDYATLPVTYTAAEAIQHLRRIAPDRETIYSAYAVDDNRRLTGYVTLKEVILAKPETLISEIMHEEIIYVQVDDDQEEAARMIQKYDFLALPVVKEDGELVGIITHDDALDIIIQEQTEDMEKFMAITGSHEAAAYMRTSSWEHFKNRAGWVVGLAILGLVSGFIVQEFEDLLLQFAILAAFMPMVADTGGNTGSQSATLIVRALALEEIEAGDVPGILWKEAKVAIMLGLLLGLVAFGRVVIFGGGSSVPEGITLVNIGFAISLALGLQVVTSTLIGALLPLGAAGLKLDPAVVASPALTTVVDITGLMIYFTTARMLLPL